MHLPLKRPEAPGNLRSDGVVRVGPSL